MSFQSSGLMPSPALRVVEFAFLERDRAFNAGAFFEQFPGVGLER